MMLLSNRAAPVPVPFMAKALKAFLPMLKRTSLPVEVIWFGLSA